MARDRENPYELSEIILDVQLWNSLSLTANVPENPSSRTGEWHRLRPNGDFSFTEKRILANFPPVFAQQK